MKHLILAALMLTITNTCLAQPEVERIANEICVKFQTLDLTMDSEIINREAEKKIQETYEQNLVALEPLIQQYAEINSNLTYLEAIKLVGHDITYQLMKDCEAFQRITMFKNGPVPEISALSYKIGADFTQMLSDRLKVDSLSATTIDECIVAAIEKNEPSLIKTYGPEYSVPFTKEFQVYLLTKCEPYMRWAASMVK